MVHQPLGATPGVGTARRDDQRRREAAIQFEMETAVVNAGNLLADLSESPGVLIVAQLLEARINELLKNDEQSQALIKIINAWRSVLTAPELVQIKINKLMGKNLTALRDSQRETSAAP
jgi:ubiquinone biosynthesis protein Coq4